MAIRLKCGGCGRTLKVSDENGGKKVKCPGCGEVIKIPAAKSGNAEKRKTRSVRTETKSDRVLFKCSYGRLPKLMLYLGLPFLGAGSIALFVAANWFNVGLKIRGLPIPPAVIGFGVAPVLLLLVIGCICVEVSQRRHPRRIVVKESGILVPIGRLKTGEKKLRWKGMTAKITSYGFMSDVYLKNAAGESTRLNLMMFRTQEDFDRFLDAIADRVTMK